MAFRIITWNINSVRARLELATRLIKTYRPDVLCLQETKVMDSAFPAAPFKKLGMHTIALHGQKNHHGVATLSKIKLADSEKRNWCGVGDARHIAVPLETGAGRIDLHNFYVPAGGDIPDPQENPKFAHKLKFLDEMIDWSATLDSPSIMVGDLNVAPLPADVWSHKQLLKVVSHTPDETQRMTKLQDAHGWVDVMRHVKPEPERLYSWWSYRAKDWRASDRGRRLDHVWVSPSLRDAIVDMTVLEDVRDWEKPSDHAPVLVDFEF
ncbi:MAG: exodeoxyribonuclease III [Pseudomonadota bacterium]